MIRHRNTFLKGTLRFIDNSVIPLQNACAGIQKRHAHGLRDETLANRADCKSVLGLFQNLDSVSRSGVLEQAARGETDDKNSNWNNETGQRSSGEIHDSKGSLTLFVQRNAVLAGRRSGKIKGKS